MEKAGLLSLGLLLGWWVAVGIARAIRGSWESEDPDCPVPEALEGMKPAVGSYPV